MRLLLATDLGERSRHAFERACRMSTADPGGELRLMHVLPEHAPIEDRLDALHRLRAMACEALGADVCGDEGRVSISLPGGPVPVAILSEAAIHRPDLILLGAHGAPRLRDAIFGTTASRVLREARRPVLIAQDEARPYARVMAAIDEASAEPVLRLAAALAPGAELEIVHAYGSFSDALSSRASTREEMQAEQQAFVDDAVAKLREAAPDQGATSTLVREGDVLEVIIDRWAEHKPDLVVMGTRGRTGLALLLNGSLAQAALLGCPGDIAIAPVRGAAG